MSPEIVALLVLIGFAAAAVVFTLVFVVLVDRSLANTEGANGEKKDRNERAGR